MKAHAVIPAGCAPESLVGWVLCHDVRQDGVALGRKGAVLDLATARRLCASGCGELHLIEMDPGDTHEDVAGARLARAAAGPGVAVRDAVGGQWALSADRRGILRVAVEPLRAVNALEGVSVYTLYDGQVVDTGEVVARAKVTPLVIPDAVVQEAEARAAAASGLCAVRGFRPLSVAALAPATLDAGRRTRFEAALREKLAWLGADLRQVAFEVAEPAALARALGDALATGADVVVAAGANALDPLDPLFGAVERLGGRFVRRGVPAHPGSLLWVARLGETPLLGMPSCGMFSQATLFDLVLPRLLAGDPLGPDELAAYGHGGLLGRDMAFRFPPYRAGHDRGAVPE